MFPALIEKLVRHEDLTAEEASAAMQQVMDGNAPPAALAGLAAGPGVEGAAAAGRQVMAGTAPPAALAGLLSALAMKGERLAEIVGFARTMRANAVKLS